MKPKIIEIYHAEPLLHGDEPEPVIIKITQKIGFSNYPVSLYEHDAEILADALYKSLPQGTADRLLYKLMSTKLSLYRGISKG